MKHNQVRFVILFGTVAIIAIFSIQIYWLLKAWNMNEKQVNESISIALNSVAHKMYLYNETVPPHENPVNQLSSNYFVVNINSVVDANILEYYLKSEFSRIGLDVDYEYAIYDCHNDKMVYGNYIPSQRGNKNFSPSSNLPKYSEYLYYFGIRFPSIQNTVVSYMTIWLILSAILLALILFFSYSILVIFRQKRFSELQKDFINNMTHEFKTPISSINISADVITQPSITSDPKRLFTYGNIIKQENARLNMLVDKVLQIARIEKTGFELKREEVELNALIMPVIENCRTNSGEEFSVKANLDPDVGMVFADLVHLTNIIYNLLDNASKYAGMNPEIVVETLQDNKNIILKISDNGPGIPHSFQKKVFRKFFRIPTGNVHDVKGFGLGLYYVRNTCKAHGWKISLRSEPGAGCTFIITIPK
ncbi:MAG: HAMP domain-containing histidine kinase [Bacteroidales bacterium]|nr:HAMP domain-containing histidine kinase [Bacteroidales bacterium]